MDLSDEEVQCMWEMYVGNVCVYIYIYIYIYITSTQSLP